MEEESVVEIITQAVDTFDLLTGEIHKNEKTDFHFFYLSDRCQTNWRSVAAVSTSLYSPNPPQRGYVRQEAV